MSDKRRTRPKPRKSRRVLWTARAVSDLEAIGDYIAADNPAAANRWLRELMAAVERAATMPQAGRRVPELAREDVREVIKRTYRIVYRVHERRIEVLTIFEGHHLFPRGVGRDDD